MMKALALLLILGLSAPVLAAEPLARTYAAPEERVWAALEATLRHLGWDIDNADRAFGLIATESRRLGGEDWGVYEKGLRHRLRVHVKAAGQGRTTVTVERLVFRRERILWIDKDEPVTLTGDRSAEKAVLDALGKAL